MNLYGAPAMTPQAFAKYQQGTIVGISLTAVPPLGQYDSSKLINIGNNRWSFKPEVGISHAFGQWVVEGMAGVWLFTDNDDFLGGRMREQDPIVATQFHLTYKFTRTMWLAGDANYFRGGRTTIGGRQNLDLQSNSRVGATFSRALGRGHRDSRRRSAAAPTRPSARTSPRSASATTTRGSLDCTSRPQSRSVRRQRLILKRRKAMANGVHTGRSRDRAGDMRSTLDPFIMDPANFSLVLGGPLFQFWQRTRLAGDALQLLHRRIVVLTLLAWAPLMVLTLAEGHAWGGVALPFLKDIEMQVRLLVAIPLLDRRRAGRAPAHAPGRRPVHRSRPDPGVGARDSFTTRSSRRCACGTRSGRRSLLIAVVYVVGVGVIWRTQMRSTWRAGAARR